MSGVPPAEPTGLAAMNELLDARAPIRRTRWTPSFRRSPDSVSAVLVESNGTALAYYPAGFDAAGLARDMQKVIK